MYMKKKNKKALSTVCSSFYRIISLFCLSGFTTGTGDIVLDDTRLIGIFLLPSNAIVQQVKIESDKLTSPDKKSFHPYKRPPLIMLYATYYPEAALPEIKKIIQDIAGHQYVFPVETSENFSTDNQSVRLNIKNTKTLQLLSDRIAREITSLHRGNPHLRARMASWNSFLFSPSITLLQQADTDVISRYNTYRTKSVFGHGIKLGVACLDTSGQPVKSITKYPLLPAVTHKRHNTMHFSSPAMVHGSANKTQLN